MFKSVHIIIYMFDCDIKDQPSIFSVMVNVKFLVVAKENIEVSLKYITLL